MEKMMKTYPYIGRGKHSGAVFLFAGECAALTMHQGSESVYSAFETDIQEGLCTNITHEYLKNTYGEVKSPEHAEFIIELAELHGFVRGGGGTNNFSSFMFYGDTFNVYPFPVSSLSKSEHHKQITIPLPPKADKQEVIGAPPESVNFRCVMVDVEWPKVGDEVLLMTGVCTVKSTADKHGVLAVMTKKGFNMLVHNSDIKKPKTPEEELRDDLINVMQRSPTYKSVVDDLIENFNITKKV